MKQGKYLSLGALIASAILFTACQSQPSTLTFTPPAPTANMAVHQSAVVFVNVRDNRPQQDIASYVADGRLVKLNASPNLTQLFQQVQQQDLVSKGFRIGSAQNANAAVTLDINQFYAKVEQGNLRYNLDSQVQVTVHVQSAKGQFSKNIRANRTYSGAFSAKNPEIQKVLGETFNEVVQAIYQDQEVANAINTLSSN
ncbi:YajG family lipoprotein [Pasteurella sp. PK-2025]|uniref:YajG family lipoprotein n=1 Tax=Pasteurella sp. PK-2025 TaxID=3413133 RepID=UPI003C761C85